MRAAAHSRWHFRDYQAKKTCSTYFFYLLRIDKHCISSTWSLFIMSHMLEETKFLTRRMWGRWEASSSLFSVKWKTTKISPTRYPFNSNFIARVVTKIVITSFRIIVALTAPLFKCVTSIRRLFINFLPNWWTSGGDYAYLCQKTFSRDSFKASSTDGKWFKEQN